MEKCMWFATAVSVILSSLSSVVQADDHEAEGDIMDSLRRSTPSGQYIDPASFFRFHGYISLSYTEAGEQLGPGAGGVPNILVSGPVPSPETGVNEGGFRNDAALFVGGEPFEGVGGVIEIHFVGDADDPVLTEAKLTWDLIDRDDLTFRVSGGRFWWPFGIHNGEWFSAVNRFSLISPTATGVVPPHYNEVGIMGEGEKGLGDNMGLNYVLSIGNGMPGMGMMGNVRLSEFDTNDNRALTGRVGLVSRGGLDAQLGLSVHKSAFRDGSDDYTAMGPDLTLGWQAVGLRSYFYSSTEDLAGGEVDRSGMTLEPSYSLTRDSDKYRTIVLVGRYSTASEEAGGGKSTWTQLGVGVNVNVTESFVARAGFMTQGEEDDLSEVDNDAFTLSVTSEF